MLTWRCSNGGASVFQFTLHKNLNAYPRVLGQPNHQSIHVNPKREISCVSLVPPSVPVPVTNTPRRPVL